MSKATLSRVEVERAARFLARMLLQVESERRPKLLRPWLAELPRTQTHEVVLAVVFALGEVVDGCSEISPTAREWVRDEVAKVKEPFRAATALPHGDRTSNGPATERDPSAPANSQSATRVAAGAARG